MKRVDLGRGKRDVQLNLLASQAGKARIAAPPGARTGQKIADDYVCLLPPVAREWGRGSAGRPELDRHEADHVGLDVEPELDLRARLAAARALSVR